MTTFFSVDVETTSTNPFQGSLLTVGIVPVIYNEGFWKKYPDTFYKRIAGPFVWDDKGTADWWEEQDEVVKVEAFGTSSVTRWDSKTVANDMSNWIKDIEPEYGNTIFVANPVAFDKPWIDKLFYITGVHNPFHYRSLCLRSMKYGITKGPIYGSDKTTHDPKIPHHALWDADAQADDLLEMLR